MSSSGVTLPLSQEALEALSLMRAGGFVNLVQLAINMEKETIELAGASTSAIRDFTHVIADDSPRFSFFVFKRELPDVPVFIYTCPPDSKIKEKMLYASCRASVVAQVEQECGLRISRKLEATNPEEIGEAQLIEELHPKKIEKVSFARPKRPGRR
ncbi:hypothetical protein FN846DRAFT_778013 [Sphaerosporella brunnea]|uniref:ADF-H domain-containing protein n=1 Tax=Sphaerosporella brunnea TaxID=1250544 RepID=A0A5J5EY89_9PEZI|nr:hypothetical protein FN846DRAFT_778013 [Sphaerosporella brunnea]